MINLFIGLVILIVLYLIIKWYFKKPDRRLIKAICVLNDKKNNNKVKGLLYLDELIDGNTHVYGKIVNLPPGKHGFHIHEKGNLTNGCESLGGHYNPYGKTHGSRVYADSSGNMQINYNRHVGDLGNLLTNKKGEAVVNFIDPLIKLVGPESVIGRSMVVHEMPDDMGKGGTIDSLKTGSAGSRIACGIIGLA